MSKKIKIEVVSAFGWEGKVRAPKQTLTVDEKDAARLIERGRAKLHTAKSKDDDADAAAAAAEAEKIPRDALAVDRAPAELLPFLAWALSVDYWNSGWSDERKRSAIRASVEIHKAKGTVGSIRLALSTLGFGDAVIAEGEPVALFDGSLSYDSPQSYHPDDHWADYRVFVSRPVSVSETQDVRRILENTAPARCRLVELSFADVALAYDGMLKYDGVFTYGAG